MIIRWHATASVELELDGKKILVDPFIPLPGAENVVDPASYDGIKTILVTHGHFDHILSLPDICRRNPDVTIYCSRTPYDTLRRKGVPEGNLHMIDFDQELILDGFTIRTYHGKHAILPKVSLSQILRIARRGYLSNLLLMGKENRRCPENDETIFYEISGGGKTVQIMGSLNLRDEVSYPTRADVLILPYNGWEDNYPPAVMAIEKLQPQCIYLDHYDDAFPPLTDAVDLAPVLQKYGPRIQTMRSKHDIII